MGRVLKILASWILVLGGFYFVLSGALDYYSSHKAQSEAAAFWKDNKPDSDPNIRDEPILPETPAQPKKLPSFPFPARRGQSFAKLMIPRLNADLYVVEGTSQRELHRGPGHMEGTSLPGGPGNCVIAGHRDTHFRVLQNIRKGDEIVLESRGSLYRYRVTQMSVISPANTQCLNPTKEPVLNLITCYPFHYVGSAPKRFIVHADLETSPDRPQSGT